MTHWSRMLACAVLVWLVGLTIHWRVMGASWNTDEVDYVAAAKTGILINALDTGSLGPLDFLEFCRAKWLKKPPALPPGYDEERDITVLRHYHPPLVVYLTDLVQHAAGPEAGEWALRSVQHLGTLALTGGILFLYRLLAPSASWLGLSLLSLQSLLLTGPAMTTLHMHTWEAVWAVWGAAFLSLWMRDQTDRRLDWILAAALAGACITLQTGAAFWMASAGMAALASWKQSRWQPLGRMARVLAIAALLSIALWPGMLLKNSLVKMFIQNAYLVAHDHDHALIPWLEKIGYIQEALPGMLFGLVCGLIMALREREAVWRWGPSIAFGCVYTLIMLQYSNSAIYFLPAAAPLIGLGSAAFESLSPAARRAFTLLVIAGAVWQLRPARINPEVQGHQVDLPWMREALAGRQVLADGGPLYRYYLGSGYDVRTLSMQPDGTATLREDGRYRPLRAEEVRGRVVIVQKKRRKALEGGPVRMLLDRCARSERHAIVAFDCR